MKALLRISTLFFVGTGLSKWLTLLGLMLLALGVSMGISSIGVPWSFIFSLCGLVLLLVTLPTAYRYRVPRDSSRKYS